MRQMTNAPTIATMETISMASVENCCLSAGTSLDTTASPSIKKRPFYNIEKRHLEFLLMYWNTERAVMKGLTDFVLRKSVTFLIVDSHTLVLWVRASKIEKLNWLQIHVNSRHSQFICFEY